jgi:hypothetical protein
MLLPPQRLEAEHDLARAVARQASPPLIEMVWPVM